MILVGICILIGFALLGITAILENTERGRRLTDRLLAWIVTPPSLPAPTYRCCLAARAGRSEAGYYLHRVREHGEGQA